MELDTNAVHDAELHAAWRAGDRKAAADLVARYRPQLRALGQHLGLSRVDADDLAQQVLLEAPRSTFEAREGSTYFNWLSTIARRKAARMVSYGTEETPVRRLTTPWTGAWRSQVLESVDAMPEPVQEVFWRLIAGYTAQEIASELRLPSTTVRMRILRGRQWLRDRGH